ncbi:MAG TPA: hypothetical protein ENN54_00170 [Thermoplasmatales archaeon]|nr:hypothetical protein [Thermoplasmatales archaeon]
MMQEENIRKEKIRTILTPDVKVCGDCREKYKQEASCSACGVNMLDPSYSGMVYECPLCNELYCEQCWGHMGAEGGHEHAQAEEKRGGIFNR